MDRSHDKQSLALRAFAIISALLLIGGYVVMAQMRARPNATETRQDSALLVSTPPQASDLAGLQHTDISADRQSDPAPVLTLSGSKSGMLYFPVQKPIPLPTPTPTPVPGLAMGTTKSAVLDFSTVARPNPEISSSRGPDITGHQPKSTPSTAQSLSTMSSSKSGVLAFPTQILQPGVKVPDNTVLDINAALGNEGSPSLDPPNTTPSNKIIIPGATGSISLDATAAQRPAPLPEIELRTGAFSSVKGRFVTPPPLIIQESPAKIPGASLQKPTLSPVPSTPAPKSLP